VALEALAADDPRVIGDFRLQSRLGAGGMGRVYLGFSPAGRAVAVKVIHPHLARDPSYAARFRREVAAAQAVNAMYATPVVAAGPDDTPPWLATAFVPAPSLQDVVSKNGPLPEEAVWRLAAGLAEALRAIHAGGLVHRDLKPGNVLLAADGPRLIDFGIARVVDGTRLTATDGVLGTPSYMSPEQAKGESVDPPSDIFSLGGVAYYAATGQAPFGGGIPAALLYRIVFDEPNLDGLPPQLRALVAACLDKNPATRPTPAQLATALMPAMPAGDQVTPSRLAFWPEPVERVINDFRARLDQGAAQAPQAPAAWPTAGGWQPVGAPTMGAAPGGQTAPPRSGATPTRFGATPTRPRPAGGRHAQRTAVPGVSRRSAIAALAGAATAGLGIAGWEIAPRLSGSDSRKLNAGFILPTVTPGTVAWRFNAKAPVSSVAQAGNVVYAATNGNAVYAVNATTGKQIWKITTTSELNSQLMVAGSSVVISGGNGPYALAAAHGKQLWSLKSDASSPMLVTGGVAYVAFAAKSDVTGGVTALDPASGTILWTFPFGPVADVAGQLALADGTVYVTSTDGELFALSAANGTKRAEAKGFGAFGTGTIAAVKGVVYAGLDDQKGTVVAVDMASGKTLWRQSLGPATFPPYVATTGGVIFAGTVNGGAAEAQSGKLYALNAKTGTQLWSKPVTGGVNEGPVTGDGTVYTGGGTLDSGILEAWQPASGKRLWSYTTKDSMGNITVVPGSRVYFGSGGYVYSLGA
jgi:outer membrane protein assembly factor BamB/tRNA A-37 threonylcarbamoyl transferase component Bud32